MTAKSHTYHPEAGLEAGRMSQTGILQASFSTILVPRPWLWLVVGRDVHSWGVSVVASSGQTGGTRDPGADLVDSRWMRDLDGLPGVALLAQSCLRKVALDHGWPTP